MSGPAGPLFRGDIHDTGSRRLPSHVGEARPEPRGPRHAAGRHPAALPAGLSDSREPSGRHGLLRFRHERDPRPAHPRTAGPQGRRRYRHRHVLPLRARRDYPRDGRAICGTVRRGGVGVRRGREASSHQHLCSHQVVHGLQDGESVSVCGVGRPDHRRDHLRRQEEGLRVVRGTGSPSRHGAAADEAAGRSATVARRDRWSGREARGGHRPGVDC